MICNTPEQAPDEAEYVEIEWTRGEPVAVNGEKLAPSPSSRSSTPWAPSTA